MKCQYISTRTGRGWNEDAELAMRFCHSHRVQGRGNQIQNNAVGVRCIGCIVGVVLFTAIVVAVVCNV